MTKFPILGSTRRKAMVLIAAFGAALVAFAVLPVQAQGPGYRGRGPGPMWGDRDMWMPGWMQRRMWGRGGPRGRDMSARMQRHWTYMHRGIPRAYTSARSTVPRTPATVAEGGKLYIQHCASCHGKTGMGDGEAGKALSPSPALLAFMIQRPMAVDEFLLWSISDGGKQFKTDMPAFKEVLKRDEIWKIVAYMRAGFPVVKDATKK